MAISLRTATGLAAGTTTSVSWTLPTGHTTNDLLFAFYAGKPYDATVGTVTDYTACGSVTSGADVANSAASVGSTRVQGYYRVHDGSESGPTGTVSATPSPRMAAMLACIPSNGANTTWTVENTTGQDSSVAGTTISATGGSLTWVVGDLIIIVSAGGDDANTEADASVSISGSVGVSALTEQLGTNTTTSGYDGSMYVYTGTITTAGTGAPTFQATGGAAGKSDRGVLFIRVNEAATHSRDIASSTNTAGVTSSITLTDTSVVSHGAIGLTGNPDPQKSGGTSHERTPGPDAVGVTDTRTLSQSVARSDSVGITDTRTFSQSVVRLDSVGISDTQAIARSISIPTDAAGVTDTRALAKDVAVGPDSVNLTDVSQPTGVLDTPGSAERLIEDPVDGLDSLTIAQTSAISHGTVGVSGEPAVRNGVERSKSDPVDITDAPAVNVRKAISDTVGITTPTGDLIADTSDAINISPDETAAIQITDSLLIAFIKNQSHGSIGVTGVPGVDHVITSAQQYTRTISGAGESFAITGNPEALKQGQYARTPYDSIRLIDTNRDVEVTEEFSNSVDLTDSQAISQNVLVSDSVGLTDTRALHKNVARSDSVSLVSVEPPQVDKPTGTSWSVPISGTSERVLLTDTGQPGVVHYVPSGIERLVEDDVHISHDPPDLDKTGDVRRGKDDRAGLADSIAISRDVLISDGVGVTDARGIGTTKALSDSVGVTGIPSKQFGRDIYDGVGLDDTDPNVRHDRVGDLRRSPYDTIFTTDSRYPIQHHRPTVSDSLSVTDRQILSGNLRLLIRDRVGLTGTPARDNWTPVWQFLPPVVYEAPIGGHRLFHFYRMRHGIAVLVTGGVATELRHPTQEQLDAADHYYLGGHVHYISSEEAQILSNAGYSDNLTMVELSQGVPV